MVNTVFIWSFLVAHVLNYHGLRQFSSVSTSRLDVSNFNPQPGQYGSNWLINILPSWEGTLFEPTKAHDFMVLEAHHKNGFFL